MTVQFNTDNNIPGRESLTEPLIALIKDELSRYADHITRIEAHLADENGHKTGQNDKRCILEARVEGKPPVAVTHHANTHHFAVEGAIDKLKSVLDTKIGRAANHH
jgi:hypothetical protein